MKTVLRIGISIFILAWLLPTISYTDWITLVLISFVLAIIQNLVRPILNLVFLPFNIVTFGFFSLFLSISLLWLATFLVPGFTIKPMIILGVRLNYFMSLFVVSSLIGFLQALLRVFIR